MMCETQREAFDLHNPACRTNFRRAFKRGMWRRLSWWKLVISDTRNLVCSEEAPAQEKNDG